MQADSLDQSSRFLTLLSYLLLSHSSEDHTSAPGDLRNTELSNLASLPSNERDDFVDFAQTHHVLLRALPRIGQLALLSGDTESADWAAEQLEAEHSRIEIALPFLASVCSRLQKERCDVTVIKSLDHWPDVGSDFDLYTDAPSSHVIGVMHKFFDARLADRSWGDRLANKWNFLVPGLDRPIEIHIGRLGQTGEQFAVARSLNRRARAVQIGGQEFRLPSPEDRVILSTLQRMYRHFYLRLCDVVDMAALIEANAVDFALLRELTEPAGIWEGAATYLQIVSDYVAQYRGIGLDLPAAVKASAKFGGKHVRVGRPFLRIPIMPHSVRLYTSELSNFIRKGHFASAARLSLLPGLATIAALEMAVTGSDKGIW